MRRPHAAIAIALAFVASIPAVAAAHVRITSPPPRSTDMLKERHCGQTGSARAHVQTARPGSTLHLAWDEYVIHPGWFRISFQQNGDTFEIPAVSNGPTGAGATSNYPTEDLTGKTDPATGSLILADRIPHGTLSMDITLPNIECDHCTLQLIQMMTDKPPYTIAVTSDDIYFACVDLILSLTAQPSDPGPVPSNGCATTRAPSTALPLLALVPLFALRRRRRSAGGRISCRAGTGAPRGP